MKASWQAGFTIIESILVLGITSLLIVGLLIGVGTSINIQRYRDSVTAFKSLLQTQYTQLQSVQNDRDNSWSCDASATPAQGGQATERGQTDCILLGRYIAIDSQTVNTASIVGYQTGSGTGNDIAVIRSDYTLGVAPQTIEQTDLEWGTELAWPAVGTDSRSSTTPRSIAILILRSPVGGSTFTFTSDTIFDITTLNDDVLKGMIVAGDTVPGQAQRILCVNSNGLLIAGTNMGIAMTAFASGPSAIEVRTNEMTANLGGDTQC